MGKETGKKVLVKVGDGADPEVFASLEGQDGGTIDFSATSVDTSDKTSDGWGSSLPGNKQATITVTGKPVWGTSPMMDILREAYEAESAVNCQFVLNTAGDMYECACTVTNMNFSGPADGATSYSFTLQNSGPVTFEEA